MTELKCPFCNQKLEPIGTSGQFQCGSWGCEASFNFIATRDVWEYIDKTRKALDKAKWWLNEIVENHRFTPITTAEMALKEITELEQKNHFANVSKKVEQKGAK